MKKLALSFACVAALAACNKNQKTAVSEVSAVKNPPITYLSAEESKKLYDAMYEVGVRDESGRIGATNLEAKTIQCIMEPYKEAPICLVQTEKNVIKAEKGKKALYNVVLATKPEIFDEKDSEGVAFKYFAVQDVACRRAVIPNAVPTCSIVKVVAETPEKVVKVTSLAGKNFCREVETDGLFGQPQGKSEHCLSFHDAKSVTDNANTFFGNPPQSGTYEIKGNAVIITMVRQAPGSDIFGGDKYESIYTLSDDGKTLSNKVGQVLKLK